MRHLLRDLAAFAAFCSMAISFEVPWWAGGIFLAALGLGLLGQRPCRRAPLASGLLLGASALALYGQAATGGLDLVVAACTFAALITAQRILSAPSPRTDQQVLLTSLLMIAGGAALSGELLFVVALVAFALLACFSLMLGVLEASTPEGERPGLKAPSQALALGMAGALLGAALLFAALPRLSWSALGPRTSRGLGAATGLSGSGVHLSSSGGTIKTNPRVVARVALSPDPRSERLSAYFVAATYATFTGDAWVDDLPPLPPSHRVELRRARGPLLRQSVELLPAYGAQLALALTEPVAFASARTQLPGAAGHSRLLHRPGQDVRFEVFADAYTYQAFSAGPEQLEAVDLEDPQKERYLSLPAGLDPRIAPLAVQLTAGLADPLQAGRKLEAWLKQGYGYSLQLQGPVDDPLADFLFERRAGHCEHFASALAVMLRTLGIPSRVATGFYGGEREGQSYLLRAGDAHAWTQLWVEGRGFVDLDATPEMGRAARPPPLLGWLLRRFERLEERWRSQVLDYSLRDQATIARQLAGLGPPRELPQAARLWLPLGVLSLFAYALWRARALRGFNRRAVHPATRLRERAQARLLQAGLAPSAGEGFEEQVLRLRKEGHPAREAAWALAQAYLEARFGGRALGKGEPQALLLALERALFPARPSARSTAGHRPTR